MKKILSILMSIVLIITLTSLNISVFAESTSWDGITITQPKKLTNIDGIYYYEISTPEELAYIAQTGGDWLEYNYILANDIVLNNEKLAYDENGNLTVYASKLNEWTPISNFNGKFNGNNYAISGVYVNGDSYCGFFSSISGSVRDLTISNSYIKGTDYVGGICGNLNSGSIYNCYFDGAVVGTGNVGGLCGTDNCANISTCGNYGDVWGEYCVAGIVGYHSSYNIENCFNEGDITATGDYVAGISGVSHTYSFGNCINKGNITGNNYVAGICGELIMSDIYNCGNTGTITGKQYVGGISGYAHWYANQTYWDSNILSSYNTGTVIGDSYVGGIVGCTYYGNVKESYNVGNVSGVSDCGTVIGRSESIWGKGEVNNCYYLKNNVVNTLLNAFGNAEDVDGIANAEEYSFFCINADNTLNIDGHKYLAPTCTKTGLTDGVKCSVCGEILTAQEEIPALGHTFGEWVVVTAPTINEEGAEERACTVCGEKETRAIEKLSGIIGDVNGDNDITAADARLALRISAGLDTLESVKATLEMVDYNGDKQITAADARKILRKSAGLE